MADEDDIEVRAILKDELSGPARRAAAAIDELGDEALETAAELEAMGKAADDAGDDLSGLDRDARKAQLSLEQQRRALKMNRDELGRFRKEHEKTEKETRRHNKTIDKFINVGQRFQKLFNKMSFSGFFRGSAKLFVGLIGFFPILIGKVLELGRTMKYAFDESLRNGGSVFRGLMAGLIAGVETAGTSFAVFFLILGGGIAIIGPLVAALSLLLGILTALVASITFALLGAVAALAGAMGVLFAGIAVGVAAFKSLDDAQKAALKADLKPLINGFKDLGKEAAKGVFSNVEEQARRLTPVIGKLEPLFFRVGHSISNIGDYFITALRSGGFDRFLSVMTKFLPEAVESLGRTFGNTLGGIAGLFSGAVPITRSFLTWIEGITSEFAEWANSAGGRSEIVSFLERAADSAKSVWNFLKEVGVLLWEILDAGASSGDSIFDDMANGIENATKWLESNPGALGDWFADAQEASEYVGDLIVDITELIDVLDSPGNRQAAMFIFQAIGAAAQMAIVVVSAFNGVYSTIAKVIGSVFRFSVRTLASIASLFASLPGKISTALVVIPTLVSAAFSSLPRLVRTAVGWVVSQFMRVPGRIGRALSPVGRIANRVFARLPAPVQRVIMRIVQFFRTLPGRVVGAIASTPGRVSRIFQRLGPIASRIIQTVIRLFRTLPGRAGAAISALPGRFRSIVNRLGPIATSIITRIVGFFQTLPGRVGGAVSGVVAAVRRHFDGIVGSVAGIPGRIVGLFSGLGGRIAGAIGSIRIPMPSIPNIPGLPPPFFAGGEVAGGTRGLVGELGPEAFVSRSGQIKMIGLNGPEVMKFPESGAVVPHTATADPFDGFAANAPAWALKTLQRAAQGSTEKVTPRAVPQPREKKETPLPNVSVGPIYATSDVDVEKAVSKALKEEKRNREERS